MRILARTSLLTYSAAAVLVLAGSMTPAGAALRAPGRTGPCPAAHPKPVSPGTKNTMLNGVAVTAGCTAWAVGSFSDGGPAQVLIEWFDGHRWVIQPTPARAGQLSDVAAISPDDAFAVGFSDQRPLILHWDGQSWQKMATGIRQKHSPLGGVAMISPTDAWAVGTTPDRAGRTKTVIVHWDGKQWLKVPSPNGDHQQINVLNSVTAISAKDAWAVGLSEGQTEESLILHWNGRSWKRVKDAPMPGADSSLDAVTALSASDVWAVGNSHTKHPGSFQPFIERWTGIGWRRFAAPAPAGNAGINMTGVAAASPDQAWAVGDYLIKGRHSRLFMERWNGVYWQQVTGSDPSETDDQFGGIATTGGNTWAVGFFAPTQVTSPDLVAFARRVR
jgi:hypothetical protein